MDRLFQGGRHATENRGALLSYSAGLDLLALLPTPLIVSPLQVREIGQIFSLFPSSVLVIFQKSKAKAYATSLILSPA